MRKGFVLPSLELRPYIDRYWFWETENNESVELPSIYAGTGTEFCFHYHNPFKLYPNNHILCPRDNARYQINQNGKLGFLSVRFKSSAFKYFVNTPVDLLKNRILTATDIWDQNGAVLEDQFLNSKSFYDRVAVLNNFFEKKLVEGLKRNSSIDWAVDNIYYNYNNVSISDIIYETNLSSRTFQRRFKETVGVSAKEFHKISRFQTVLKKLLLNKEKPTLGFILDAGYFDQSHFNKDFKKLAGSCPSLILRNSNLAHFYNTSLK